MRRNDRASPTPVGVRPAGRDYRQCSPADANTLDKRFRQLAPFAGPAHTPRSPAVRRTGSQCRPPSAAGSAETVTGSRVGCLLPARASEN